jgi:RNA polymerase sigma factor (sigma-70 family)
VTPESYFEEVYGAYRQRLIGIVRRWDSENAEDIAEDVFVRAWIHRQQLTEYRRTSLDGPDYVLSWLSTVARHILTDRSRRERLRFVELGTHDSACSDGAIDRALRRMDAARALASLTPEQREVVVGRFYRDRLSNEVAQELGTSVDVVKKRQERAVASMMRFISRKSAAA